MPKVELTKQTKCKNALLGTTAGQMKILGYKTKELQKKLGISEMTMTRRGNDGLYRFDQLVTLTDFLDFSDEQILKIFGRGK